MPLITIYLDENGKNSVESVMATVVRGESCWQWPFPGQAGRYKKIEIQGKKHYLHRLVYEQLVGEIPEGYEVDHLCRNPSCCNPEHLEAVPKQVNILRGDSMAARWARRTHCEKGHPLDDENTRIYQKHGKPIRKCAICQREKRREVYARDQARIGRTTQSGMPHGARTCRRGHLFDEGNTMIKPDGRRRCRACANLRDRESKRRRREAERE